MSRVCSARKSTNSSLSGWFDEDVVVAVKSSEKKICSGNVRMKIDSCRHRQPSSSLSDVCSNSVKWKKNDFCVSLCFHCKYTWQKINSNSSSHLNTTVSSWNWIKWQFCLEISASSNLRQYLPPPTAPPPTSTSVNYCRRQNVECEIEKTVQFAFRSVGWIS